MITGGYPDLCISSYYKKEQEWFAKTVTTSRFTGQVIPRSGKQLTHIVRVMLRHLFLIIHI